MGSIFRWPYPYATGSPPRAEAVVRRWRDPWYFCQTMMRFLPRRRTLFLIFYLFLARAVLPAQAPDPLPLPVVYDPEWIVYIHPAGDDTATGDSLQPLATFAAALDRLAAWTDGETGDLYAEVVLQPGTYPFALAQPPTRYLIGDRRLNVSVRGLEEAILDGEGISLSPGSGMVHLLGSHIAVRNLTIAFSPANGVRFGFDWNGTVINPGDILIEDLDVNQTAGHGIYMGIGPLNTANPLALTPKAERFAVRRCRVTQSVNYNQPAAQWGSAIKFHNLRFGLAEDCIVHDNGGEGINVDLGEGILLRNNVTWDNLANIYLDKAEDCTIEGNLVYYTQRVMTGILLGLEPFSALVTDHFMRNIHIRNNIILNTGAGINVWQGTIGGLQRGYFTGIDIRHNTILGKRVGNGAPIGFSYQTFLGQPVPNTQWANLKVVGNIVAADPDSLNAGRLLAAPLEPQPGLETGYNLWSKHPVTGYDPATDRLENLLPFSADPLAVSLLTPHADSLPAFLLPAPNALGIQTDFLGLPRGTTWTNAGALERDSTEGGPVSLAPSPRTDVDLFVFPQPFLRHCRVQGPWLADRPDEALVWDSHGRLVPAIWSWDQGNLALDLVNVTPGIYLLVLRRGPVLRVLSLVHG